MTINSLLARLRECPLVVSAQASDYSPLDHPDTLLRMARASLKQGVRLLRLEGVKNLRVMRPELKCAVIGLLKRTYPDSDVYITPTAQDADSLIDLGVEIVALDATARPRPGRDTFADLVTHIHRRKTLVMADCDSLETALAAEAAGADIIGTTLAGYTPDRRATVGPDLDLLRQICQAVKVPVIAEGRFSQRWEVDAALRMGAVGVVVGGAINDPVKQTRAMMPPRPHSADERFGAVDIGGTNLRFGVFSGTWELLSVERAPNPEHREDRLAWIRAQIANAEVEKVGVSTGGVTDPRTGTVVRAKAHLMPDHEGIVFSEETLGVPTIAWGDGHATAWAHACLPAYAGSRVATLAIGTGVGCGFVENHRIWCGRGGDYPRVNDLPSPSGETYERVMGGKFISSDLSEETKEIARQSLRGAASALHGLYFPDHIFVAGSVGLSEWMVPDLEELGLIASPFGTDAGLYGAAAIALYPPAMPTP